MENRVKKTSFCGFAVNIIAREENTLVVAVIIAKHLRRIASKSDERPEWPDHW
jgi:hypothetical protein